MPLPIYVLKTSFVTLFFVFLKKYPPDKEKCFWSRTIQGPKKRNCERKSVHFFFAGNINLFYIILEVVVKSIMRLFFVQYAIKNAP